jgi:hypothetical protein
VQAITRGELGAVVGELLNGTFFSITTRTSDGLRMQDLFRLDVQNLAGTYTNRWGSLTTISGSLWGCVREFIPTPFFEAWADPDVATGQVERIVVRKPPFNLGDWRTTLNADGKNTFLRLGWDEVLKIDVAQSISDVYSIFDVTGSGSMMGTEVMLNMVPPLISSRLLERYGVRMFSANATFVRGRAERENESTQISILQEWRNQLAEWYCVNDLYESGELVIRGRTDVRVGDKIELPDGRQFYVEQVVQRYQLHPLTWQTTLGVTRGGVPQLRERAFNEAAAMRREVASAGVGEGEVTP